MKKTGVAFPEGPQDNLFKIARDITRDVETHDVVSDFDGTIYTLGRTAFYGSFTKDLRLSGSDFYDIDLLHDSLHAGYYAVQQRISTHVNTPNKDREQYDVLRYATPDVLCSIDDLQLSRVATINEGGEVDWSTRALIGNDKADTYALNFGLSNVRAGVEGVNLDIATACKIFIDRYGDDASF